MGKSYFERTGKTPPSYMIKRGKALAAANKKCAGTGNDKGQFYDCVERNCREHADRNP